MTWHLKDRELEKKLIEICPNFLEFIDFAIQTKEKDADYINVEFDRERVNVTLGFNYLYFWDDELEEVPEYNPKAWNDSRKVTPPENVIFMAKVYKQTGVYYKALIYKDSKWYYVINGESSDTQMYLYEGDYVEFRPWED